MTKNRVLTLDEVLALPEGAKVWVDANPATYGEESPGVHLVVGDEEYALKLVEEGTSSPQCFWPIENLDDTGYGNDFRAWLLPQPPTAEELTANPCEEENNAKAD